MKRERAACAFDDRYGPVDTIDVLVESGVTLLRAVASRGDRSEDPPLNRASAPPDGLLAIG